jgi:hypothetical protein
MDESPADTHHPSAPPMAGRPASTDPSKHLALVATTDAGDAAAAGYQRTEGADASADRVVTAPSINVSFEYVHPNNVDLDRLDRALQPLRGLQLAGSVQVVVTSDLAASHKSRVHKKWSAPFDVDRVGTGRVIAKAVTDQDASTAILLDAVVLLPSMQGHTDMSSPRLVWHEGIHLLLRDRGEDAHTLVEHGRAATSSEAERTLMWMSALALEEYRIERALCEIGSFATEPYEEEMPRILDDAFADIARKAPYWSSDSTVPAAVLATMNAIVSKVAFLVAQHDLVPAVDKTVISSLSWRALVGPGWDAMRETAAKIPHALVPVDADELRSHVAAFAKRAEEWCAHVGIRLGDDPDGVMYIESLFELEPGETPPAEKLGDAA